MVSFGWHDRWARRLLGLAPFVALVAFVPMCLTDDSNSASSRERVVLALVQDQDSDALVRASEAIALNPEAAANWLLRAQVHARLAHHDEALADFGEALARDKRLASAYDGRRNEHLKLGHIEEAPSDFDGAIRWKPRRAAGHWQHGIALYYAKRYGDGAEQFAAYQTVDDNDVENAVWRLMC